jgi:hypothetical protein
MKFASIGPISLAGSLIGLTSKDLCVTYKITMNRRRDLYADLDWLIVTESRNFSFAFLATVRLKYEIPIVGTDVSSCTRLASDREQRRKKRGPDQLLPMIVGSVFETGMAARIDLLALKDDRSAVRYDQPIPDQQHPRLTPRCIRAWKSSFSMDPPAHGSFGSVRPRQGPCATNSTSNPACAQASAHQVLRSRYRHVSVELSERRAGK